MDYSEQIIEAFAAQGITAEAHKSTTNHGRYRLYIFINDGGVLEETLLVGVQSNGDVTDQWKNVRAHITL